MRANIFGAIKERLDDDIRLRVKNHILAKYQRIDIVKPVRGMFNYRCHENAIQYAFENPGMKVIEVFQVELSGAHLHYINQNEHGEYLETTLGWKSRLYEYYYVRELVPDDYDCIGWIFDNVVDTWSKEWLKWYHYLFGIHRVC